MEVQVGDWILYRSGPVMKVSVVRYILHQEPFALGETHYQTDEARVRRTDIHEVRRDNNKLAHACEKLGAWMAAATDDDKACPEFKHDAEVFLEAIFPYLENM